MCVSLSNMIKLIIYRFVYNYLCDPVKKRAHDLLYNQTLRRIPTCVTLPCLVAVAIRAVAREISSDGVATVSRPRASAAMAWHHLVAY